MKQPLIFVISLGAALIAFSACKPRNRGSSLAGASSQDAQPFTGNAPYKLVFMNHSGPQFNPNEDLLAPSAAQLAREQVTQSVTGALMKSLIPLYGNLTGNTTGTETDVFQSLLGTVSKLQIHLQNELKTLESTRGVDFPHVHDVYLIPWKQKSKDAFYSNEKISVDATGVVNVLGVSPTSESFSTKVTEEIQKLQVESYKLNDPFYLLGFRSFLFINPGSTKHTLRVLLGVKPLNQAFSKINDKVKLERVVVPDLAGKGIVASLKFEIDLSGAKAPTLTAEFGEFEKIEKGEFKVITASQAKMAPRLEGNANKKGLSWVATNFSFARMIFDLRQMQLTNIDALVSPGLKLGSSNFVVGGFNIQSVDKQFQDEINGTIDSEVKSAVNSKANSVLGGMMTKEIVDELFAKIFTREVAR